VRTLPLLLILLLLATPLAALAKEPLSLTEAVAVALAQNTEQTLSTNAVSRANTNLATQRDAFLPSLALTLAAGEQSDLAGDSAESVSGRLAAALNLFRGYGDEAALAALKSELAAAEYDQQRQQQSLIRDVTTAYVELLTAQGLSEVQREQLKQNEAQLEQISAQVEAGRRPRSDQLQQQAEVANARKSVIAAEQSERVALLSLLKLMQLPPQSALTAVPPEKLPEVGLFADLLPEDDAAVSQRPDLQALAASSAAAVARIREAKAGSYPTLDLSLGVGSDYSSRSAGSVGSQFDDNLGADVGLSLSIPLFDRNQTRHAVALATLARQDAALQQEQQALQAATEAEEARLAYATLRQQSRAADAALAAAQEALDAMSERYRVGAATLVELVQQRSTYASARYDVIASRYSLLSTAMNLVYALGNRQGIEGVLTRWERIN